MGEQESRPGPTGYDVVHRADIARGDESARVRGRQRTPS